MQKKQTPLHLAASAGQLAVCSLLLELGASLDATDDYGQKPIHLAAQSNKAEVVKVLLKLRPNSVSVATKVNITNRILWMTSNVLTGIRINYFLTKYNTIHRMEILAPISQHLKVRYQLLKN